MSNFDLNKCNLCGRFKSWKDLASCAGDSDDVGNFDEWFECRTCSPLEFKIQYLMKKL